MTPLLAKCQCARVSLLLKAHQARLLQLEAKVGEWVMLAVREGAITYHKAKVTAVKGGKVVVRHNDLKGTLEEVPATSPRLWHGTLDDKAWEVGAPRLKEECHQAGKIYCYSKLPLRQTCPSF